MGTGHRGVASVPRFSLVVPTLRRADTFRHALATLVEQTDGDFEIVVQNNGRNSATESILDDLGHPLIRHYSTDTVLPMTENWEAALGHARGEYITFIGDDDGLFPDACRIARGIIDRGGFEIVSWRPYCYYWPDYIHAELRNRLIAMIDYDPHAQIMSSAHQLQKYYQFAIDYSRLPMIYNSFVQRPVIERAQAKAGRYFLGFAPDVTSGIVNAAHTSQFVVVSRPLSITGLSRHSTGHTMFMSDRDQSDGRMDKRLETYRFDDRLVPLNNLQVFLANEMIMVRDRVLADRELPLDFRRLTQFIAAAINDRPGFYEETLEAIKQLAQRHAIDPADIAIPRPAATRPPLRSGSRKAGRHLVHAVIDGDRIGLHTIADAVRLMEQFACSSDVPENRHQGGPGGRPIGPQGRGAGRVRHRGQGSCGPRRRMGRPRRVGNLDSVEASVVEAVHRTASRKKARRGAQVPRLRPRPASPARRRVPRRWPRHRHLALRRRGQFGRPTADDTFRHGSGWRRPGPRVSHIEPALARRARDQPGYPPTRVGDRVAALDQEYRINQGLAGSGTILKSSKVSRPHPSICTASPILTISSLLKNTVNSCGFPDASIFRQTLQSPAK